MDHDKVIENSTALEKILHYRVLALLTTLVLFLDTGLWVVHDFGIADLYPLVTTQASAFHKTFSVGLLLIWIALFSAYLLILAPVLALTVLLTGEAIRALQTAFNKNKARVLPAGVEETTVSAARLKAIASRDAFTLSLITAHNRERQENFANGNLGFALLLCVVANIYVGFELNSRTITRWLVLNSTKLPEGVGLFALLVAFCIFIGIAVFSWGSIIGDGESLLVPTQHDSKPNDEKPATQDGIPPTPSI